MVGKNPCVKCSDRDADSTRKRSQHRLLSIGRRLQASIVTIMIHENHNGVEPFAFRKLHDPDELSSKSITFARVRVPRNFSTRLQQLDQTPLLHPRTNRL